MQAMAGVWLNVNSSALSLQGSAQRRAEAEAGLCAYNEAVLEFARVPEGLRVETCSPDFDLARRTGRIACDETTIRRHEADDSTRACPGAHGFSLVDCMKPLQFDAGSNQLMRRSVLVKAHFGSLTRVDACGVEDLPEVAWQLCRDLEDYSVVVPAAASHGTTSLVKYEFLAGYGCLGVDALVGSDTVLLRRAAPNRVVSCPSVANGNAQRINAWTCGIECHAGFRLEGGLCVSSCAGLNETCAAGHYAAETCHEGARKLYKCEACMPWAGRLAATWRAEAASWSSISKLGQTGLHILRIFDM
jgi:hypothetical protein